MSSSPAWRLLVAVAFVLSAGCESDSFVPSRPTELSSGRSPSAAATGGAIGAFPKGNLGGLSTSVGAIELISAPYVAEEAENLKSKARAMAGYEQRRIQITVPGEKGAEGSQAALVRRAMDRNPLALIIEPADPTDSELIQVVKEASSRGLIVIVMGRELAIDKAGQGAGDAAKSSQPSAGPIITILPDPLEPSAKQLAEAAINNAKNVGHGADMVAIVAMSTVSDSLAKDRVKYLIAALRGAGVGKVKEMELRGEFKDIKAELTSAINADPKIGMVLASDHNALTAAFHAMTDVNESHKYVVAGYTSDDSSATMTRDGEFAAAAVYSPERVLRKAISAAVAAIRGEKQADHQMVMVPVSVSPKESGAPRQYKVTGPRSGGDPRKPQDPDDEQ